MKIFISYSHTNTPIVNKMVRFLETSGHQVWWDKRLLLGEEWAKELENQIASSEILICALSPGFFKSDYCKKEMDLAIEKSIKVFSVIVENVDEKDITEPFIAYQRVDISKGFSQESYAKILGGLTKYAVTVATQYLSHVPADISNRDARLLGEKYTLAIETLSEIRQEQRNINTHLEIEDLEKTILGIKNEITVLANELENVKMFSSSDHAELLVVLLGLFLCGLGYLSKVTPLLGIAFFIGIIFVIGQYANEITEKKRTLSQRLATLNRSKIESEKKLTELRNNRP